MFQDQFPMSSFMKTLMPQRRARSRAAGTLALDWVSNDVRGASILATAKNLLAAEQAARDVLPPAMAHVCRVARIENKRLTLAVPSAAYASKLRQLVPDRKSGV